MSENNNETLSFYGDRKEYDDFAERLKTLPTAPSASKAIDLFMKTVNGKMTIETLIGFLTGADL